MESGVLEGEDNTGEKQGRSRIKVGEGVKEGENSALDKKGMFLYIGGEVTR